ncbi:hypothetical protein Gotur_032583, partial [Gossypium turneri]
MVWLIHWQMLDCSGITFLKLIGK